MSIKLLLLDIDGTVVNNKKEITPRVKAAIIAAQKKGVKVAIASGRATNGITPIAKALELDVYGGYIMSFNGGKITNCKSNEVIYEKTLPTKLIKPIYEKSKEWGFDVISYDDTIICENDEKEYVQKEIFLLKMPVTKVKSLVEYITFPVNKLLVVGEEKKAAILEKELACEYSNTLNIFRSEPYFIEIMPKDIDKAYSAAALEQELKIKREEIMAIGDGFNDLSMIEYAGVGVAMENAQQCVKEAADFITLSNENDGVAFAIEKFII